jgi:hypothetical protein
LCAFSVPCGIIWLSFGRSTKKTVSICHLYGKVLQKSLIDDGIPRHKQLPSHDAGHADSLPVYIQYVCDGQGQVVGVAG